MRGIETLEVSITFNETVWVYYLLIEHSDCQEDTELLAVKIRETLSIRKATSI